MWAQVVRVQIQAGKTDEAVNTFRSAVIPAVREREGLKGLYLLLDRENSRAIGLSLWNAKEDVEALATSGFYQEQIKKFGETFAAPPEREVYEVAAE